jgi:hypothetical protein
MLELLVNGVDAGRNEFEHGADIKGKDEGRQSEKQRAIFPFEWRFLARHQP